MKHFSMILLIGCLSFLGGSLSTFAQDDDYNPTDPAEPGVIEICRISVASNYPEGSTVSGAGRYKISSGSRQYISTSARNNEDYTYTFKYWTKNGEIYSYSTSFYYTLEAGEVKFVAHYEKKEVEFDPDLPAEPSAPDIKAKYRLYLTSNLEGSCSFNISSGDKHEEGSSIRLSVNPNAYFSFQGWQIDGKTISTSKSFYYTMPSADVTIEAVFVEEEYDPDNPLEPSGSDDADVDTSDPGRKLINLTIGTAAQAIDKTRVVYNETKSLDYDMDCDAAKFISTSAAFQIYSIGSDGSQYQINERPLSTGTVQLGIMVKSPGSVTISATRADCTAILVDKLLGTQHDLTESPYIFTSAAGTFNDRFVLKSHTQSLDGDANGDDKLTIADVACILCFINGGDTTGLNASAADANHDGTINLSDVQYVVDELLEK